MHHCWNGYFAHWSLVVGVYQSKLSLTMAKQWPSLQRKKCLPLVTMITRVKSKCMPSNTCISCQQIAHAFQGSHTSGDKMLSRHATVLGTKYPSPSNLAGGNKPSNIWQMLACQRHSPPKKAALQPHPAITKPFGWLWYQSPCSAHTHTHTHTHTQTPTDRCMWGAFNVCRHLMYPQTLTASQSC